MDFHWPPATPPPACRRQAASTDIRRSPSGCWAAASPRGFCRSIGCQPKPVPAHGRVGRSTAQWGRQLGKLSNPYLQLPTHNSHYPTASPTHPHPHAKPATGRSGPSSVLIKAAQASNMHHQAAPRLHALRQLPALQYCSAPLVVREVQRLHGDRRVGAGDEHLMQPTATHKPKATPAKPSGGNLVDG